MLSALVVKGSFFIVVRLWFDVMPGAARASPPRSLLGALGAAAIVFGSVLALRQERLKLLIAYSTLAQIGYLFLMFPLAFDPASGRFESGDALAGGHVADGLSCDREGCDVPGGGRDLCGARPRPHRGLAGAARALPVQRCSLSRWGASR